MAPPIQLRQLGRTPYAGALALQRSLRDALIAGETAQTLLLTEHDPVVTLGRRGDRSGIHSQAQLREAGIDLRPSERGGHVTYHGPGQLVAYPILDLRHWDADLGAYIARLERCAVELCARYGVEAQADSERHGVFTERGKIASVGVHVRRWISIHGLALNLDPNMSHWALIDPCNLPGVPATSIALEAGTAPALSEAAAAFAQIFASVFAVELRSAATPAQTNS